MSATSEHERLVSIPLMGVGGVRTPGSRYGQTAITCATWASAAHQAWLILGGVLDDDEDAESRSLESFMSWTVNDSPEPALLVSEAWYQLPRPVKESLGRTLREVKRMAE